MHWKEKYIGIEDISLKVKMEIKRELINICCLE